MTILSAHTDVHELARKMRDRINDSVIDAASKFAIDSREKMTDTYDFYDPMDVDESVVLKMQPEHGTANVRVINRAFSLERIKHVPPASRKDPGYTLARIAKTTARFKGFPIKFNKQGYGSIMATRSGIKRITEGWQVAQSSTPFSGDMAAEELTTRRETSFETYERHPARRHTFMKVRTKSTANIVRDNLDELLDSVPKNVAVELSNMRTVWRKKKRKGRK